MWVPADRVPRMLVALASFLSLQILTVDALSLEPETYQRAHCCPAPISSHLSHNELGIAVLKEKR
jgi:hypothetical protein